MDHNLANDILQQVEQTTGCTGKWEPVLKSMDKGLDGYIILTVNDQIIKLPATLKETLYAYQYPQLLQLNPQYKNLTIMTEIIPPALKQQLKKAGINYMDAAGNIYLKTKNQLLYVDGMKREAPQKELKAKPFGKTGLKILFAFLTQDNLINATIREIAEKSDASLDSVHRTVTGLKQLNFLIPLNKDTLLWNNKKELLQRWITEFDSRLKPELLIGPFRFVKDEDFNNWKKLPLTAQQTYWGGEAAGDLYTNYLKPAVLTLYTQESRTDLMKNYRLIPDPKGNILVYNKFWKGNPEKSMIVPPLLAYTDLINAGNTRTLETAQKIYDQFLQNQF